MKTIILASKTIIGLLAIYSVLILFVSFPYDWRIDFMLSIYSITICLCVITYLIFTKRDLVILRQFINRLFKDLL